MFRFALLAYILSLALAARPYKDHCTAVAAGSKATADGSTFVGQTADAEGGPGISVVYVPADDHPHGSQRPIYDQTSFLAGKQVVTGYVPQVNHTYGYVKGRYGMMNEHQLAFGESTCSGRIAAASVAQNGTAIWSDRELTLIALERCKTARCAIKLMGQFAMEGGFYGESDEVEDGSETLMVADPSEAWVFHILADPTGRSAIWAAQRVPDDKIAFVPNAFVIRAMNLSSDDFMLSSNAVEIAKEFGWWNGAEGTFDFAGSFSLGEYEHPFYAARRLWRAFNLVAPSVQLDSTQEITPTNAGYPFAVKPEKLLEPSDVFRVYRDYYEGTPYSLVKDELAAGPFNSPRRIAEGLEEGRRTMSAWERPISIYRADHAYLNQAHPDFHGIVWFGPHIPHATVFSAVWTSGATRISRRYVVDKTQDVDRESLFWAVSAVGNWAHGSMFNKAIHDIRAKQMQWENRTIAVAMGMRKEDPEDQNTHLLDIADELHRAWWDLFWSLMFKYSDGYVVTRDGSGLPQPEAAGCPAWYLDAVHYDQALGDARQASFVAQKHRMDDAAKQYADIKAKRKQVPPPAPATLVAEAASAMVV